MSRLVNDDRRLLERLFWEGSTEVEVAGSMGISQQAVSKRKLKILAELRRRFGGRAKALKDAALLTESGRTRLYNDLCLQFL